LGVSRLPRQLYPTISESLRKLFVIDLAVLLLLALGWFFTFDSRHHFERAYWFSVAVYTVACMYSGLFIARERVGFGVEPTRRGAMLKWIAASFCVGFLLLLPASILLVLAVWPLFWQR